MTGRRAFAAAVVAAALGSTCALRAQTPAKSARIGALFSGTQAGWVPSMVVFRRSPRELGWVPELGAKRLQLLHEAVPGATRVAVMASLGNPATPVGMRTIEQPMRFEPIPIEQAALIRRLVNQAVACAIGLTISQPRLLRAAEVVQCRHAPPALRASEASLKPQ